MFNFLTKSKLLLWAKPLLLTAVITILAVYLVLVLLLYFAQEWLIFPGKESQGQPYAVVKPFPGMEVVQLSTAQGDQISALFGPALTTEGKPHPNAAQRPTLLYFYGNAMCARFALDEFQEYRRLGLNVMIPDYVGFGMSSGQPSEAGCYATAEATYTYLGSRADIDSHKIVVLGRSLGSGVAVDLASRKPVAALMTLSAYSSLADMAHELYPYLPVSLFLKHRFDSQSKIGKVHCPILVAHGKNDDIISFRHSQRLASAAKAPVTQVYLEHFGHNDFFGPETIQVLRDFLDKIPEFRQ